MRAPCTTRCGVCRPIRSCAHGSAPTLAGRSPRTATRRGRAGWPARSPPRRAASVDSPMRRTIVMALLGVLLFAAPALAQGTRAEILRDCQDDGILQGDYTAAQMRDARNHQPTEVLEYSDCGDVLSRGIADKTASNKG